MYFKSTQRAMYITTKSRKPLSHQQMRLCSPPSLTAFRQEEQVEEEAFASFRFDDSYSISLPPLSLPPQPMQYSWGYRQPTITFCPTVATMCKLSRTCQFSKCQASSKFFFLNEKISFPQFLAPPFSPQTNKTNSPEIHFKINNSNTAEQPYPRDGLKNTAEKCWLRRRCVHTR